MGHVSTAPTLKTEPPLSPDDILANRHIIHPRYSEIYSRTGFGVSLYFLTAGHRQSRSTAVDPVRLFYAVLRGPDACPYLGQKTYADHAEETGTGREGPREFSAMNSRFHEWSTDDGHSRQFIASMSALREKYAPLVA